MCSWDPDRVTKPRGKEKVVRLEKWELRRLAEKYAESRVGREDRFFAYPVQRILKLLWENSTCPYSDQEWLGVPFQYQTVQLRSHSYLLPFFLASPSPADCTWSPSDWNVGWRHNRLQCQWWQVWRSQSSWLVSLAKCTSSACRENLRREGPDGRATLTSRVDGKGLDRQQQAPPGDDSILYTILFNV